MADVRDYGMVDGEFPRQIHYLRATTGLTRCGKPIVRLPADDPNVWPICEECRSFYDVHLAPMIGDRA